MGDETQVKIALMERNLLGGKSSNRPKIICKYSKKRIRVYLHIRNSETECIANDVPSIACPVQDVVVLI